MLTILGKRERILTIELVLQCISGHLYSLNRCTSCREESDGTWSKLPRNLAAGSQIVTSCENVWELCSDAISLTVQLSYG